MPSKENSSNARAWLGRRGSQLGFAGALFVSIAFAAHMATSAFGSSPPTVDEPQAPKESVQNRYVFMPIHPGPKRVALGLTVGDPSREQKSYSAVTWRQPVYSGAIVQEEVEEVISDGRAEALEHALVEEFQQRLYREVLLGIQDSLADVGALYNEEVANLKATLRHRPDRYILLDRHRRELDPNFMKLIQTRRDVEGKAGAVWGDYDPETGKEIHYIMLWSEWPLLRQYTDDQSALIQERREQVRRWISEAYTHFGMSIFDDAKARSP